MRSIDTVAEVPYRDPWAISLEERLHTLAGGRQRIAYFYELADNSTFRYRAYNMTAAGGCRQRTSFTRTWAHWT